MFISVLCNLQTFTGLFFFPGYPLFEHAQVSETDSQEGLQLANNIIEQTRKKDTYQCNKKAITVLYEKHKKSVQLYIQSAGSLDGQIDDLVHEAFLTICEGKSKYCPEADIRGYLFGIAKNIIHRHLRKTGRQIKTCSINDAEVSISNKFIDKTGPFQEIIYLETFSHVISKMLARLPAKSRQAAVLVLLEKLKPKEAAGRAGCSVAAFYQRFRRARKMLEQMNTELMSEITHI